MTDDVADLFITIVGERGEGVAIFLCKEILNC